MAYSDPKARCGGSESRAPEIRSVTGIEPDTFDACHAQILLGSRGVDRCPSGPGCGDGSLWRGRRRLLRYSFIEMVALLGNANLVYPTRHLLDSDRMAGHRAVHRPGGFGRRAQIPAAGRQF